MTKLSELQKIRNEFLNTEIRFSNLSQRLVNGLIALGVEKIKDIKGILPRDLHEVRNFGAKTIAEFVSFKKENFLIDNFEPSDWIEFNIKDNEYIFRRKDVVGLGIQKSNIPRSIIIYLKNISQPIFVSCELIGLNEMNELYKTIYLKIVGENEQLD